MARELPRASFNRSRLVGVLADLAATELADSKQPFAERVGQWLDVRDSIALFSTLGARPASVLNAQFAAPSSASAAMHEEFSRVREALVDSITTDGVFKSGKVLIELPTPAPSASADDAADFSAYQRYYLAHQRDMGAGIAPLRANVRAALASHSTALKRLADLDAVLDQALGARERALLATLPLFLATRFEALYKAHQAALPEAQAQDDPQCWMQPAGWLAIFCKDMQGVLLAELDLRLEPVVGLMEALGNETRKQQ